MNPNASPLLKSAADSPDAGAASPPAAANRRFLYAGGTRPLEGYTLKRGVGQGGFGEIYYAVSDSGKEVALKLIRRNLEVELRGIRQCLNLKHPNLLNLFDIRQDDNGDTWVVMEYVGGLSLQDAIDAQPGGMPIDEALAWIHGIGAAVAYLHDHGIVHRDLKPANIFSDDGIVKVGDYGLSKFISCSRRSGHTESIGTVHYMAPEVANGRYGKEIDVYALGIILYEMLTGRVPFDGESVGEVLMKHLTAQPDVSMLPEPYRGIAAKAMEKDPERRYRSANEFLAALPPLPAALPGTGRLPSGSRGPKDQTANGQEKGNPYFSMGEGPGARAASSETVIAATAIEEEPILRAVREAWTKLVEQWNNAKLNPTAKVLILSGAIVVLLLSMQMWVPLCIVSLIFYGIYRCVRWMVLPANKTATASSVERAPSPPELAKTVAAPAQAPPMAAQAAKREREHWRRHYEKSLPALVLRAPRERVADLLGSMLLSTLVAAAMTAVMAMALAFRDIEPAAEQLAWLFAMSVAGSWTVLVPSKWWEGTKGESMPRRFFMMVLGLGLGVLAWLAAGYFQIELPYDHDLGPIFNGFVPKSFYANASPLLPAYVTVFGTLFLLIRWWRQADPLRSTRLSILSLVVTVLIAGVIAGLWHFPQPWLPLLAATISVSVQLSSPWVHPRERAAARS
ncbi:MAG: protein kinase [Pirellulales bacterium]|nr:protein kinase [Pirellulales bacterium]